MTCHKHGHMFLVTRLPQSDSDYRPGRPQWQWGTESHRIIPYNVVSMVHINLQYLLIYHGHVILYPGNPSTDNTYFFDFLQ